MLLFSRMTAFKTGIWVLLCVATAIQAQDATEAAGSGLLSGLGDLVNQGKEWLSSTAASAALASIIPDNITCPSLCVTQGATVDYPDQVIFQSDFMGGTNITCQGLDDMLSKTTGGADAAAAAATAADSTACVRILDQIANLSGLALQGMCGCLDAPPPPKTCFPCGADGPTVSAERPASGGATTCAGLAWNAQFIINATLCDSLMGSAMDGGCCGDMAASSTTSDSSPGGAGAVGGDTPPQVSPPVDNTGASESSSTTNATTTQKPASSKTSGAASVTRLMQTVAILVVAVAV